MAKMYVHLTAGERERIRALRVQKKSYAFISKALSRSKSTIWEEIHNHLHHGAYEPDRADTRARVVRKKPRRQSKMMLPKVANAVKDGLRKGWSPEQISGRMRLDYPRSEIMRISRQSIYAWLHKDKKAGGKWYLQLRRKTRKYRKLDLRSGRRLYHDNRKSIDERPQTVAERRFYGDWEADSVDGKLKGGHLLSFVERKSSYTVITKMARKDAESFNAAAISRFQESKWLPLRTLTVDNGSEFTRHAELSSALAVPIFFAHPLCAWQRGLNENTNGLLRQYFPKGKTDFALVSDDRIAEVEALLNNRPRKKLGYRTPAEVMDKFLRLESVRLRT